MREQDARFVPWAFGINGSASVVGTILSVVLAMSFGFQVVSLLAAALYLGGAAALWLTINYGTGPR